MAALQRIIGQFAGSNTSSQSASASLARAGVGFANLGRQVQGDERLMDARNAELAQQQRFERVQNYAEGADARKVAAEQLVMTEIVNVM